MAHMHDCWRRHYGKFQVESLLECTTELCIDESLVCFTEILWEVFLVIRIEKLRGRSCF